MNGTTVELVTAARDGSREAFSRLVELSWARLVRFARTVAGDAEAEDAVQEALLLAWSRLPQLADLTRFDAWLARIVYRRCLRRTRRMRLLRPLEEAPERSHDPEISGQVAVADLLARLAPRQRAVLHLTVVEEMSDGEIGRALGITAGSVRAHRRRARQHIALLMQGGTHAHALA